MKINTSVEDKLIDLTDIFNEVLNHTKISSDDIVYLCDKIYTCAKSITWKGMNHDPHNPNYILKCKEFVCFLSNNDNIDIVNRYMNPDQRKKIRKFHIYIEPIKTSYNYTVLQKCINKLISILDQEIINVEKMLEADDKLLNDFVKIVDSATDERTIISYIEKNIEDGKKILRMKDLDRLTINIKLKYWNIIAGNKKLRTHGLIYPSEQLSQSPEFKKLQKALNIMINIVRKYVSSVQNLSIESIRELISSTELALTDVGMIGTFSQTVNIWIKKMGEISPNCMFFEAFLDYILENSGIYFSETGTLYTDSYIKNLSILRIFFGNKKGQENLTYMDIITQKCNLSYNKINNLWRFIRYIHYLDDDKDNRFGSFIMVDVRFYTNNFEILVDNYSTFIKKDGFLTFNNIFISYIIIDYYGMIYGMKGYENICFYIKDFFKLFLSLVEKIIKTPSNEQQLFYIITLIKEEILPDCERAISPYKLEFLKLTS